jgi:hypothetical protein
MGKRASVKVWEIAAAGAIAGAVIACGEAMMDGGGGLMEDAGGLMADAGDLISDAGTQLIDAGRDMMEMGGEMLVDAGESLNDAGESLRDTGTAMRDASSGMMQDSASAQNACGTCTAGDRQMVVTADQDVQQLRGGTVEGAGWTERKAMAFTPMSNGATPCLTYESRMYAAELADGPLVLTDLYATSGSSVLFTVPSSGDCVEAYDAGTYGVVCGGSPSGALMHERLRQPQSSRTLFTAPSSLSGARILIRPGETLCALTGSAGPVTIDAASGTGTRLVWAGFAPYE